MSFNKNAICIENDFILGLPFNETREISEKKVVLHGKTHAESARLTSGGESCPTAGRPPTRGPYGRPLARRRGRHESQGV
jgi:hypothetical protein